MTMTADAIVDRRRLRRKLSFWRFLAFLVLILVVIVPALLLASERGLIRSREAHIARIAITGFISDDRRQLEMLDKIAKDDSVKGVILAVNSGGGTTVGGEALYLAVRRLAQRKPTVAELGTVAASAAYMTAIAAEHIVARRASITGSIGVIFEYPEVSELMAKLGVKMEELKSAPLKAEPSPFHPASEESKAVMATLIADSYRWFVDIVAERRRLSSSEAAALADGRVFTGNQALAARLVDEIGGEDEALAWLDKTKGVSAQLPIRDWKPASERTGVFSLSDAALLWIGRQLGIAPETVKLLGIDGVLLPALKLDGLLSLWQGSFDQRDGEGAR